MLSVLEVAGEFRSLGTYWTVFCYCHNRPDQNMAKKKKKKIKELQPNIKVRLDGRTVITVRDPSKLDFWREKYPKLEILEES